MKRILLSVIFLLLVVLSSCSKAVSQSYDSKKESRMSDIELITYYGYGYKDDYSDLSYIATKIAISRLQGSKIYKQSSEVEARVKEIETKVDEYKKRGDK